MSVPTKTYYRVLAPHEGDGAGDAVHWYFHSYADAYDATHDDYGLINQEAWDRRIEKCGATIERYSKIKFTNLQSGKVRP